MSQCVEGYVRGSGLDASLLHLVKLHASQINGYACCVDPRSRDASAGDETEQRRYGLAAWRETPFLTELERAALAWTEAVARVSEDGVPDDLYDLVREHFSDSDLVDLTIAAVLCG